MIILKVKDKEYQLKFGYKSFKKSGILREVVSMRKKLYGSDEEEKETDGIEALEEVLELNSKLVLAALQKFHEEFRVEYGNPDSVQAIIDKVDDLMDDYMDEEDSMSIMDLFTALTEELFSNGFLSKKSEVLEDAMTEQDATIAPKDHKQKEN